MLAQPTGGLSNSKGNASGTLKLNKKKKNLKPPTAGHKYPCLPACLQQKEEMQRKKMAMNRAQLLLLFVVLMLGSGASAAAAAELSPKADDCSAALLNLSACLSFVEKGAGPKAPEKGCCPSLAGLVDSNPFCLCQLLSTSDVFGIQIDAAKALTLPSICRLHTPPVSLCSVLGIPVPSPAAEPSGSPAPGAQMAAPPSEGSDGGLTAGVNSLMGLLAIVSQAAVLLF